MGSKSRPHPRARRATSVHRAEPLEPRLLLATISGQVWNDADGDGRRDLTDRGLAGWTVYVDLDDDNAHDGSEPSAVTDSSGNYSITSLAIRTGTYAVREVAQPGWRPSDPATGERAVTFLRLGDTASDVDFGNTQRALVTGTVFDDANEDGAPDRGEDGLGGWTVFSDANANGLLDTGEVSDLTDLTGDYALILPAGSHTIRQVRPAGWWQTGPAGGAHALTLSNGQVASNRHFGNVVATYDLFGAGFGITSAFDPVPADGLIDVLYQIRNAGTADSPGFRVAFYLSDDATITTGDTLLRFIAQGSVPRRSTADRTTTLTLPRPDPFRTDNQYWVGMIVDESNDVAETNETNNANQGLLADRYFVSSEADLPMPADGVNVGASPVAVGGRASGVIGDEWIGGYDQDIFRLPVTAGHRLELTVEGMSEPAAMIRLYNGTWSLLELAVGTLDYTAPASDTYYVVVSGGNNGLNDPRRVSGRHQGPTGPYTLTVNANNPDLEPMDTGIISGGSMPGPTSQSFSVSYTGGFPRPSFDVSVYLSDDDHISAADILLTTVRLTASDYDNELSRYFKSVSVTAPATDPFRTDNQYWIGVVVDSSNELPERDETNNGRARRQVDSERDLSTPTGGAPRNVPRPRFDTPAHGEIGNEWIGPYDQDVYGVDARAGERLRFDVDTAGSPGLNSYVRLYDASWNLLAANDNGAAPGESVGTDSYLEHTFSAATSGWLVVSGSGNHSNDPRSLGNRSAASTGDFDLTITHEPAGPLTGVIFDDANLNGTRDPGEAGLPGWTVYADLRDDGNLDPGDPSDLTGGSGEFTLTGLRSGPYVLRRAVADGWIATSPPAGFHPVVTASGLPAGPYAFGNVRGGVVSGTVYDDSDRNGSRGAAEPGLPGRTVYLDLNNNGVRDVTTLNPFVISPTTTTGLYDLQAAADSRLVIADVDVLLRFTAVGPSAFLSGPDGTRVELFNFFTDSVARNHFMELDDEAQGPITPGLQSGQPALPLAAFDRKPAAGRWRLLLTPNVFSNVSVLEVWALAITLSEPFATTDSDGGFRLEQLSPGTYHVRVDPDPNWVATAPPAGGHPVTLAPGEVAPGRDFGAYQRRLQVTGRHVFYNNSAFDGRSTALGAADDAAVATDKTPLVAGAGRSAANVTGYNKGINGVMVDVEELLAAPTLADFSFKVPSSFNPSLWLDAPAPTGFSVRGLDAADPTKRRVTFTWPDNLLRNVWLQVSTLANDSTRRLAPDVFYFGNLVGETGGPIAPDRVNALDFLATRAAAYRGRAGIDNRFDHDRDGFVTVKDVAIVRSNLNRALPAAVIAAPAGVDSAAPPPADHRATGLLNESGGALSI